MPKGVGSNSRFPVGTSRASRKAKLNCGPRQLRSLCDKAKGRKGSAAKPRPPSALPCLFVTTTSKEKEDNGPLPGPRKKQADGPTENIKWMADTFGKELVGFLTLTVGDVEAGGRFRNLRDRKQAQKRFRSMLTNVIAKRYACGL